MNKSFFFNFVSLGLLITSFLSSLEGQEGIQSENLPPSISEGWVATDALGRKLPAYSETGSTRPERYVAMFYWTWHTFEKIEVEPINVDQIVSHYPEAINDYNHPQWTQARVEGVRAPSMVMWLPPAASITSIKHSKNL